MRAKDDAAMYPRLRDLWHKGGVYRQITGTEKNRVYFYNTTSKSDCSYKDWLEWCKDAEFLGNPGDKK